MITNDLQQKRQPPNPNLLLRHPLSDQFVHLSGPPDPEGFVPAAGDDERITREEGAHRYFVPVPDHAWEFQYATLFVLPVLSGPIGAAGEKVVRAAFDLMGKSDYIDVGGMPAVVGINAFQFNFRD